MLEVASYVRNNKGFRRVMPELLDLSPKDMVMAALAAGEASSIRNALRQKNIGTRVKKVLRSMQVALRNVEGTESEREVLRFKLGALRLWTGCSLLFPPSTRTTSTHRCLFLSSARRRRPMNTFRWIGMTT